MGTTTDIRPLKALARTAAETALEAAFTGANLPGTAAISARRQAAFASFAARGLPHRRIEAWHYTDLRTLLREALPLASAPDAAALDKAAAAGSHLKDIACRRLYVVDGSFVPELSDLSDLEEGLSIRPLAAALGEDDPLVATHLGRTIASDDAVLALNSAFMSDGVVVHVAAGAVIERPLALIHVSTSAAASFTRSLVVLEKGAGLTLLESHESPANVACQVNCALELVVGEEARLDRVKLTLEGDAALHLASVLMTVAASAKIATATFTSGGAVVRNQTLAQLDGARIEAWFGGVSLLCGRQHADTLLNVEHVAPEGQSREVFRAVLDDGARDAFQGRIAVRAEAQKTDARMMSRALLLSDRAESDNKPELEIFADDVQCAHGCTTGALDQQVKFYMMSRGIPEKEAEALLIEAFVGEVLDGIAHEGAREALRLATHSWLKGRAQ